METLTARVGDLMNELPSRNQPIGAPTNTQGSPWTNTGAVQRLRSSFMVKPFGLVKADIKQINKIVVDNKLQVNKIGESQTGNTFIHCPSEDVRNTLQQKLETELARHTIETIARHSSINIYCRSH